MAWTERYVRADAAGGGDGTTDANSGANGAFTLAEAITHSATNTGQRYNVKAGTFTNTTTSRTFNGNATTTAPNWWRGFKTTAGDMDGGSASHGTFMSGAEIPAISFTTGRVSVTGTHQIFSNLDVRSAATANATVTISAITRLRRVRAENTNAGASSRALATSAVVLLDCCWFKATGTATSVANATGSGTRFQGCVFTGGGFGADVGAIIIVFQGCLFNACGSDGINIAGTAGNSNQQINGCLFYACGRDGVRFSTVHNQISTVTQCLFVANGGYGINNASGANTNLAHRESNGYYSNTSGTETGFGDSPAFGDVTLSADPFVDSSTGDFNVNNTSGGGADLRTVTYDLPG